LGFYQHPATLTNHLSVFLGSVGAGLDRHHVIITDRLSVKPAFITRIQPYLDKTKEAFDRSLNYQATYLQDF
jgi:hypothetical protein